MTGSERSHSSIWILRLRIHRRHIGTQQPENDSLSQKRFKEAQTGSSARGSLGNVVRSLGWKCDPLREPKAGHKTLTAREDLS